MAEQNKQGSQHYEGTKHPPIGPEKGEFDVTNVETVNTETQRLKKTGIRTPVGPRDNDEDVNEVLTTGADMGAADDQGSEVP